MDDILIYSKTYEEHLHHVNQVMKLLSTHALYTKPSKCEFLRATVPFLGYIVGSGCKQIDPDKVAAIVSYATPKSPKAL